MKLWLEMYSAIVITALLSSYCTADKAPLPDFEGHWKITEAAVEQAHTILWRDFVGKNGVVHDFAGEIPTSEDCEKGLRSCNLARGLFRVVSSKDTG